MAAKYKVAGMTCGGCAKSVEKAIKAAVPAAVVEVDLASGTVSVSPEADAVVVGRSVEEAGFDFLGPVS